MATNAVEIKDLVKCFEIKRIEGSHSSNVQKTVLNGLNLTIPIKECVGILGRNGSGKSTLLKLISKILYPDSGTINIRGNVASILELGMGFHPDLSGRENIFLKSSMFGFSKKETEDLLDSIIEFSELGEQIDDPLRTYSSGMTARLAFSIMINVKCDILIVDEVLSVGDVGFNSKCSSVFTRLKNEGKTIILASNALETLENMCDRVVWLDDGKVREIGPPETVCYHYKRDLTDSPSTIRSLAEAGDVGSQNRLGIILRDGIGVDADAVTAESWFRKAATSGNTDAMVNLADILMSAGRQEEAREYYAKASALGNQYAQIRLISDSDDDISLATLERASRLAEAGNIRAMALMGDILSKGIIVQQDRKTALEWQEMAAMQGDVPSMLAVGLAFRDGNGTERDPEKAEMWLSKAALAGNARARQEISNMFRKGMGVERDMTKVIRWLNEAFDAGDANSAFQLGSIYREGTGVDADTVESQRWMTAFASLSRSGTEYIIGDILQKAYDSDADREEAISWLEKAANDGSVPAMFQLGTSYRDGVGVEPDSSKAARWFLKAAEHWHQQAMVELGSMFLRGNGVEKNDGKAAEFYSKAASMGNAVARYQLGIMYRDGIGMERDTEMAIQLLKRASENGNRDAILALTKIDSEVDSVVNNPGP